MRKRNAKGQFVMEDGGGTYVDSEGYIAICAGPLRGMRLHVLLAIAKFGAKKVMRKDRVVHHKDGNKLNPHPDNLELKTESEHNAVSAKQYWYLKKYVWPKEKEEWDAFFAEANRKEQNADY